MHGLNLKRRQKPRQVLSGTMQKSLGHEEDDSSSGSVASGSEAKCCFASLSA